MNVHKHLAPSERYADGVVRGAWQSDSAQQHALPLLDRICQQVDAADAEDSFFSKISARFSDKPSTKGLYLWGGVGRGKTFLTDLLFESLSNPKKVRWHFHRFMQHIHAELRQLPNTADTIAVVAKQIAKTADILILDEFFVSDIGDAMILGRLLDQLFERGVCLVTTSNIPPNELYRDGLQRASFLPAIALIEQYCDVLKLESLQDYRLRQLRHAATYLSPCDVQSEWLLQQHFDRLTQHCVAETEPLVIHEREIEFKAMREGVVWFEFSQLCEGPRAAADYIEIARDFHTVLVSNVPRFDSSNEDPARRFVHMIDEFYDRHVNLLLSAQADALSLYRGTRLQREFERTSSRLIEMQSQDYLALEHRP
jgi:cell division protein ZapE